MKHFQYNVLTAILLSLALFSIKAVPVFAESSPLVTAVELEGNRRVSNESVYARIKSRVGDPFSKDLVQQDITQLYGLGYFDDIRVDIDPFEGGVKLIFILTEKPSITTIDFQGNKEYEAKDLREKITLTAGAIANLALINDNAAKLVSYYQSEGYWLVNVMPVIREISKDAIALTYLINEGPKVVIKDILIEGNKSVSTKEIKKAMKTKERGIFSFITGTGIYQKEQVRADMESIRDLYQNRGFLNIVISEPVISLDRDKKKLSMTISVQEGEQYSVGKVGVTGNSAITEYELLINIKMAPGQIFSRSMLRSDIDRLVDLYLERGYAQANIDPLIDVEPKNRVANIMFSVTEGEIFRIGRIDISGNTKTRDKVIRREMRLNEGDIFNKKLLKRSYQRINNLNYFETVDIAPYPQPAENRIDLNVRVKEKLTGMLSLGGGYSSQDKFMVMGEITQGNLFGKGLYLKLKADLSSRRTNYSISLRDPWFMDKPISASIGLFNESYEYPDYKKQATGGNIGFGKEFSEYVGGNITYSLESVEVSEVKEDASSLIRDQEGKKLTSSISPSVWKDTRDNYLDPTSGYRHALYTTFAGLGGDNYFAKALADSVWYFPLRWESAFGIRGRLGYASGFAGKELPIYERFYAGGINTIRGLGFGEAGPRNEEGEKIGGNIEMIVNAEYIFPILKEMRLKGVTFFDYGSTFDKDYEFSFSDMRKTAGFGFRWLSPFGPLRLEWGFNLDRKEDESANKLEFSIGGFF